MWGGACERTQRERGVEHLTFFPLGNSALHVGLGAMSGEILITAKALRYGKGFLVSLTIKSPSVQPTTPGRAMARRQRDGVCGQGPAAVSTCVWRGVSAFSSQLLQLAWHRMAWHHTAHVVRCYTALRGTAATTRRAAPRVLPSGHPPAGVPRGARADVEE